MTRGCLLAFGIVAALLLAGLLLLGRVVGGAVEQAIAAAGATAPRVDSGLPGTLVGGSVRVDLDGVTIDLLTAGATSAELSGVSLFGVGGLAASPPRLPDGLSLDVRSRSVTVPVTVAGRTVTFATVSVRGPLEAVAFEATIDADGAAEAFAAFLPGVPVDPTHLVIDGTSILVTDGPSVGIRLDFTATATGFRSTTPASTSELRLPDGLVITGSAVRAVDGAIVFSGLFDLRAAAASYGFAE